MVTNSQVPVYNQYVGQWDISLCSLGLPILSSFSYLYSISCILVVIVVVVDWLLLFS